MSSNKSIKNKEISCGCGHTFEVIEKHIYGHRIYCGDSTDKNNIKTLMNNVKADMVFTDIACEITNRDCRIMELDPKYAQVIVQRWIDFTDNSDKIKVERGEKKYSWNELISPQLRKLSTEEHRE